MAYSTQVIHQATRNVLPGKIQAFGNVKLTIVNDSLANGWAVAINSFLVM